MRVIWTENDGRIGSVNFQGHWSSTYINFRLKNIFQLKNLNG